MNIEYNLFGVMLDCSRNAVMKPQEVKRFIDILEKMGFNSLELYTEDTYKIPDEPYFGYMRGGYTNEEIRDIDEYAKKHGVELIPCIQTLAHMNCLVKLPYYNNIVDCNNIMLVGEEKTYELIEKMFKTLASTFTSRHVNIGMDEAHMLGLGKYLTKNGYRNRVDIFNEHLNRVCEIAKKYGFKPHMWSDMYFRLKCNGLYDCENVKFDEHVIDSIPEDVSLTFWSYEKQSLEEYDKMFKAHEELNREIWFAGGVWGWNGFAPANNYSIKAMKTAMQSVIKHNVKNVLITFWGDNGKECSFYSLLPALYATKQYSQGNYDMESIKQGFKDTFNVDFDDFTLLDMPNAISRESKDIPYRDYDNYYGPCKTLLYSDCFLGRMDKALESAPEFNYTYVCVQLEKASKKAGEFSYIFDALASLSAALAVKKDLGLRSRKLYKEKDILGLYSLANDYQECISRVESFYQKFKYLWMKENKPFGFEVHEIRIGGLLLRLKSCKQRILDFCSNKISVIDELEETLLPYGNNSLNWNKYIDLVSPCDI